MRISPINNNINKNLTNKTILNKKSTTKKALMIIGAVAATTATSVYINRDEWKTFFNDIKEDKSINIQQKPIQKNFDSQESALNYAFDIITYYLNTEAREYSIYINNNKHQIISESLGNNTTVRNFAPLKMFTSKAFVYDFSYTALHGHPTFENGATSTFSFTDFNSFVNNDNCSVDYVLNKDRKYCRFRKTENYIKPSIEELIQLKNDYDVMIRVSKFKQKIIKDKNNNVIFNIIDEPAMHSFWDRMCKKFGIEYTTTFGTYGLYDNIYENGYYEGFYQTFEINDKHIPML